MKPLKLNHLIKLSEIILLTILVIIICRCFFEIISLGLLQWNYPILKGDSWAFTHGDISTQTINWLLSQHNEHRIVLAKLSTLAETNIINVPIGQTGIFQNLALLLAACGAWSLIVKELIKPNKYALTICLSGIIIILNPWQYENLSWEFQSPWFFINTLTLIFAYTLCLKKKEEKSKSTKLYCDAIIFLGPWLAIFSTGQGIALALALCICSWIHSRRKGIISSFSSAIAIYTTVSILNYEKPEYHPEYTFNIEYFVNLFSGGNWEGLIIIVLAASLALIKYPKILQKNNIPTILLPVLFSVLFSIMTTISRSNFGPEQANSSRYVTHSSLTGLSCLLLITIFFINTNKKYLASIIPGLAIIIAVSLPINIFTGHSLSFNKAFAKGKSSTERNRLDFICLAKQSSFKQANIDLQCNKVPAGSLATPYFNGELATKPLGWHKNITLPLSSFATNHAKNFEDESIEFHVDNINIEGNKIFTQGWAYNSRSESGLSPLYLVAKYANSKQIAVQIDSERPDIKKVFDLKSDKHGWATYFPKKINNADIESLHIYTKEMKYEIKKWAESR